MPPTPLANLDDLLDLPVLEEEDEFEEGNVNKVADLVAEGAVFDDVVAEQDQLLEHKVVPNLKIKQ